ncbi:MAG TPA: metallophosphoesterase [Methylomirabilota bacterium]|nr:metallophosphoesterase [Methylomirabilota bacterium]
MPRLLLFLALLLAPRCAADEIGLIRVGEPWRYYPVTQAPAGDWRSQNYDDSAWASGPGGFSAGIGWRLEEATQLSGFAFNYHTVLFRKQFTVADTNLIQWLALRADWDDGFIAYLNGVEVLRRGFFNPTNPVALTAHADFPHGRPAAEELDITAHRHLLLTGTNTLAVQVHNAAWSATASTMCWAAELLANFTRSPFIQNTSSNSVQIIFKTLQPTTARVTIAPVADPSDTRAISAPFATNKHVVTVTNLIPDQQYSYQVTIEAGGRTALSPPAHFKTLSMRGAARFYLLGDSGSGSAEQVAIAQQMRKVPGDFVVLLGDVVYPSFVPQLEDLRLFSVYADQMRTTPFFLAAGNHDGYAHRPFFFDAFYLPTNNMTGGEEFYSFDHGAGHFIVLDTDLQVAARYDGDSPQYKWLEADLAATRQPWKMIFFHHIIRSSAYHNYDDYNRNGIHDSAELQFSIGTLAEKYGVQLIVTGHDHIYERLKPRGGTTTIVSGGGGEDTYWLNILHPESARFMPAFHYLKVELDEQRLHVQALGADNAPLDELHLFLPDPPTNTHASTWHTPVIEAVAGHEDANIPSQEFDFVGEPIPTRTGQLSSLGAVHVSNDREMLHIGFATPMLPRGADLLVFIGAPGRSGVRTMQGVGNGLIDPDGEGADGLDVLENLSFSAFEPAVAAILGDEQADGTARGFGRAGASFRGGQGVFHLRPELPTVAGARIQQFNTSPQTFNFPWEEDADYIKVSIPLSALNASVTGDVQVAAVVALPIANLTSQRRDIDGAVLGEMKGSRIGPIELTPVRVKLANGGDSDGDGATDTHEAVAGTDPNNPASVLRLKIVQEAEGHALVWDAVAGKTYTLQTSTSISAPAWTTHRTVNGVQGAQRLSLPRTPTTTFWRLAVQ